VIKILKNANHGDLPIGVSRAYVDAQRDFATEGHNGDGILEYAQSFASRRGKEDGLYWTAKAGAAESPVGPLMAQARAEGSSAESSLSREAPALSRLLLQDPQSSRKKRARWRLQLFGQWSYDWRFRNGGLRVELPRFGRHDVHRQPGWRGLREESRSDHDGHCTCDDEIRSESKPEDAVN